MSEGVGNSSTRGVLWREPALRRECACGVLSAAFARMRIAPFRLEPQGHHGASTP